jgi:CubicO group peptidase (beta-lactamase class C family)
MKKSKNILIVLFSSFLIFEIILYTTGFQYLNPAIWHNFPNIDDQKIFFNRTVKKSKKSQKWPSKLTSKSEKLPTNIEKLETTALLVIKNDTIVYEYYSNEYHNGENSNSFSMAKSYVSALIGCAIKDGLINSIEDPVGNYLKNYPFSKNKNLTIKTLLTMSSGLSWDESYQGPFSITTKAYYGDNIDELIHTLEVVEEPSQEFKYLSGNTQILAMILEKVTKKRLSKYLEEKIWQPLQSTSDASWSLDSENGMEKAYCCINSNARNFARLGSLYLKKGKWNDQQIIPEWYVNESTRPAILGNEVKQEIDFYGYQWWLIPEANGTSAFYARGILGQFIICIPEKNMVIVRLGKKRGNRSNWHYPITYELIDWGTENF